METLSFILSGTGVSIICFLLAVWGIRNYRRTKSHRFIDSLPGLFTSLGILGTFVAICNSLSKSKDLIDISSLIGDITPAFTSSIAGLLCAFAATIFLKYLYIHEDKQIDNSIKNETPEKILFDIRDLLSKQLTESSRFNGMLDKQNEQLQDFIKTFVARMDKIFTDLHKQIEGNIKDFGKLQILEYSDMIQKMNTTLQKSTEALIKEQKTGLASSMETVASELKSSAKEITATLSTFSSAIDKNLGDMASALNNQLSAINTNYNQLFNNLYEKQAEFATGMKQFVDTEFEKAQQRNVESLEQMTNLKDAFQESIATMLIGFNSTIKQSMEAISSQQVDQSVKAMTEIMEHSKNCSQQIASTIESINNIATTISNSVAGNAAELKDCYTFISDHIASIKANYESAVFAYQGVVANANRNNENQEQLLAVFSQSLESVKKTNDLVAKVIKNLESQQDGTDKVIAQINQIGDTITTLKTLEQVLNKIANK